MMLAAPLWAQTARDAAPTQVTKPNAGATESGAANMERPGTPPSTRGERSAAAGAVGCDKLTGKTREDCLAGRDASPSRVDNAKERVRNAASNTKEKLNNAARNSKNPPLAGGSPTAGASESGPATMERPATANTRDANASAGGAKAPDGAASNARRGTADKPVR
jgi:hypothetical protein